MATPDDSVSCSAFLKLFQQPFHIIAFQQMNLALLNGTQKRDVKMCHFH